MRNGEAQKQPFHARGGSPAVWERCAAEEGEKCVHGQLIFSGKFHPPQPQMPH